MTDYLNGKSTSQNNRIVNNITNNTNNTNNGSKENISEDVLVSAMVKALSKLNLNQINNGEKDVGVDDFDNSSSLEKIAESMTVQRSKNEANFNDLGKVKRTKGDKDNTDKMIDLLSNIDD